MAEARRRYVGLIAVAACLLVALVASERALACSCLAEPAEHRLKRAEAAAEVEVVRVHEGQPEPGSANTWFKARLIRVHKGPERLRGAETVRIHTGEVFNSCSWAPREGAKLGLLLSREGRDWYAGLCDIVGRKDLRHAAEGDGGRDSRSAPTACRAARPV